MAERKRFEVRFWGVRGRIPCPGPATARYGGNTRCIEVRIADSCLVFDAGTGLRPLGEALSAAAPVKAELFLSYTGRECIAGIPFFSPAYDGANAFRLWAGRDAEGRALREVLAALMNDPVFPVPVAIFDACFCYEDFTPGAALAPASGITVRTARVHPCVGISGFRIEAEGRSVCYLSDFALPEAGAETANGVRSLIAGADLAILGAGAGLDGTAEWRAALRLAREAGVGTAALARHEPDWDDEALDRIADEAETIAPGTIVAREGLTLAP